MKASLYKGLDEQGKVDVRSAFLSALPLRKQLIKIFNDKIEVKRKKMVKESEFDKVGRWDLKMADSMGYERAMRDFISLLEEKVEENEN